MRKRSRLKRQLFREVVDENIDTIQDQPPGAARRRRKLRLFRIKRWLLALFGSSCVVGLAVAIWMAAISVSSQSSATGDVAILQPVPERVAETPELGDLARVLAFGEAEAVLDEIPLAVKRIVVDAGHGGRDSGTALKYGMREKDLTIDIGLRLRTLLEAAGIEVIMTRTGDEAVSLRQRANTANQAAADLFVSIHVNWLPDEGARGVETYYYTRRTDDPFIRRLARLENRDSGFSVADYRKLLKGIYAKFRRKESSKLARAVQRAMYQTLVRSNERISDRGVMTAPFVVLAATEMPAILVEVACISNDLEARLLARPRYRQSIAEALLTGIRRYSETRMVKSVQTAETIQTTDPVDPGEGEQTEVIQNIQNTPHQEGG